jgi:hypothetical protein
VSVTGVETCALHRSHGEAVPLVLVTHHVQPLGMGGANAPSNRVRVCDNGHRAVHTLLGSLAHDRAMPDEGTPSERAMAQEGFRRWVAAGRPGDPHAAYGLHVVVHPPAPDTNPQGIPIGRVTQTPTSALPLLGDTQVLPIVP